MRFGRLRADGVALVLSTLLVACASDDAAAPPAAPSAPGPAADPAAAAPQPVDHGAPSTKYPAFAPSVPKLVNQGGAILATPVIVTITFPGDANAATYEQLADEIGTTPYWSAVVGEYGIGKATSGTANHVHAAAPLTLAGNAEPEAEIEDYVVAQLSDTAASHWPEPTPSSIYTLFIAGSIAQSLCDQGVGGSHASVMVKGKRVAYAMVLTCEGDPTMTAADGATISASHEWAEAATDPHPDVAPAWAGLTDDDLGWELFVSGQDENGDLCEFEEDSYGAYGAPQLTSAVQRQWSNASAAAGHSPCVPAPPRAYFNATLLDTSTAMAHVTRQEFPWQKTTRAVNVPLGQKKDIVLGFNSDGPTEAFKIEAFEYDPFDANQAPTVPADKRTLTLSLDKTTGQNGEKSVLSVTVDKPSPNGNIHMIVVASTLGEERHMMPIVVTDDAQPVAGGAPANLTRLASRARVDRRPNTSRR